MLDSNERFRKMSSLAQIGWWEADFLTGHFVCSEFLADLFGLDNDMISFEDFISWCVKIIAVKILQNSGLLL